MVLGKFPEPGHLTIWIHIHSIYIVGQGTISLAVGAGGGCLDIFTHGDGSFKRSFIAPSLS